MTAIKANPIFVSLVCFVVNKIGLQIETFNHENHQIHEMSLRAIFLDPKKDGSLYKDLLHSFTIIRKSWG